MARKRVNKGNCTHCDRQAVARKLCAVHYGIWRNRQQKVVTRTSSVHEAAVNGVVLPVRKRRWEWLGNLQDSLRVFNALDEELEQTVSSNCSIGRTQNVTFEKLEHR
jgi:hypothetical protein